MNESFNIAALCSKPPADRRERLLMSDQIFEIAINNSDKLNADELHAIIGWLKRAYNYTTNDSLFETAGYTFRHWFTRKLKNAEQKRLIAVRTKCHLSSPCEADLINCGPSSAPIKIKKELHVIPAERLQMLGLAPDCQVINLRLRKPYYHWVHSPTDGMAEILLTEKPGNNSLFGGNSFTILKIGNETGLIMIGERSVQGFRTVKKLQGMKLKTGDPVGNFDFGSQVLILNYNRKHTALIPGLEQRLFVIDPLIR